jgi:outer membrane lipoprotein
MMRVLRPVTVLLSALFLTSCAHVISKDLRERAERSLAFGEVFQNPEFFQGRWVIWGGELIETTNRKDGTTVMEVFQRPLGWRGEPRETPSSGGRFLVAYEQYLDPYVFRKGKRITVGGEVKGQRVKPLGEMDYRYPLVLAREIHLWEEYYYDPYPYPYYPYYPWWGYPYGGSFGIYYHYHRHR